MQIFIPYQSPYKVAKVLDKKRLWKQILECNQIIKTINKESISWKNHPVIKMYENSLDWLLNYRNSLYNYYLGNIELSKYYSKLSITNRPYFFEYKEIFIQHRKRLFTKNQEFYKLFRNLGVSDENWYIINEYLYVYKLGKLILRKKIFPLL